MKVMDRIQKGFESKNYRNIKLERAVKAERYQSGIQPTIRVNNALLGVN